MALVKTKPTSAGRRSMVKVVNADLHKGSPYAPLVESQHFCPLWGVLRAFDRPGSLIVDLVALEGGDRWLTLARTVQPHGRRYGGVAAEFAIGLGLDARLASPLIAARGIDLATDAATPIGLGCRTCTRDACPQRSAPPAGRPLIVDDRARGVSPFGFAGD